jgi:hypothetical protein
VQNGVEQVPPIPMGLQMGPDTMTIDGCKPMAANPTFADNLTDFSAANFTFCLCGLCTNAEAASYDANIYFNFFLNDNGLDPTIIQNFNYSISEINGERTLTILSEYNEQAIYSNVMLSKFDLPRHSFVLYPNPGSEFIHIDSNSTNLNTNTVVDFYNELGQLCKSQLITSGGSRINIQELVTGIYIIKIYNDFETIIKKYVKN